MLDNLNNTKQPYNLIRSAYSMHLDTCVNEVVTFVDGLALIKRVDTAFNIGDGKAEDLRAFNTF